MRRWLLLCVPVLLGASIMALGHAPLARSGVQLAACVFGLAAYFILTRAPWQFSRGAVRWVGCAAAGVVALTLARSGIQGVQRWHDVGPLLVQPSALLTPALLVLAAAEQVRRPLVAHGLLGLVQVVHLLQPDAGQATALGLGGAVLAGSVAQPRLKLLVASLYLTSGAAAWLAPDPLPPAAFVEDIVSRAFALTPVVGVVALVSLGLLVVAPLSGASAERTSRGAAWALATYFAGSLLGPCFGEFPVPLLGFGSSPLVGAFLGLAALRLLETPQYARTRPPRAGAARSRRRPSAPLELTAAG